jgi:TatD DNase family protein
VVTFKNGGLDKFIAQIPLENIVLETDAPYLAPAPYRGKRNESSYIRIIAEKLAGLYEAELEKIASITTQNSRDIFGV